MSDDQDPRPLFEPSTKTGSKVRCKVCGKQGYGPLTSKANRWAPWQLACVEGHPYKCSCGKRFSSRAQLIQHVARRRTAGMGTPEIHVVESDPSK